MTGRNPGNGNVGRLDSKLYRNFRRLFAGLPAPLLPFHLRFHDDRKFFYPVPERSGNDTRGISRRKIRHAHRLAAVGYYFGYLSGDITYAELIRKGTDIVNEHYLWIIAGLAAAVAAYAALHRKIMGSKRA